MNHSFSDLQNSFVLPCHCSGKMDLYQMSLCFVILQNLKSDTVTSCISYSWIFVSD